MARASVTLPLAERSAIGALSTSSVAPSRSGRRHDPGAERGGIEHEIVADVRLEARERLDSGEPCSTRNDKSGCSGIFAGHL